MKKTEMTELIVNAKKKKKLSWTALAEHVGMSEVYVASCCYGENSMLVDTAGKLCAALDLDDRVRDALVEFPTKGNSIDGKVVPTDPMLYRFYEILCVYGTSLKDVIQEKFGDGIMSAIDFTLEVRKEENPKGDRVVVVMNGDGIMSAIDFTLEVRKEENPKGDRVVVVMNGKFLPYKRF